MGKPKAEWVVCDSKTQTMRCEKCGDEIPLPLGTVPWFCGVAELMVKIHAHCDGKPGKTCLATPSSPPAKG